MKIVALSTAGIALTFSPIHGLRVQVRGFLQLQFLNDNLNRSIYTLIKGLMKFFVGLFSDIRNGRKIQIKSDFFVHWLVGEFRR